MEHSSGLSTPRCWHSQDKHHLPDHLSRLRHGAAGGERAPGRGSSSVRWTPCARARRPFRPPAAASSSSAVAAAPRRPAGASARPRGRLKAAVGSRRRTLSSRTRHRRQPCPGTVRTPASPRVRPRPESPRARPAAAAPQTRPQAPPPAARRDAPPGARGSRAPGAAGGALAGEPGAGGEESLPRHE